MNESIVTVSDEPVISPHPLAPLYDTTEREQQLLFRQAVTVMLSRTALASPDEAELLRETGFVNLWFFERFIASYSGPYDLLNDRLHLDMANFYQVQAYPGTRSAGFVFRGAYKSSIWTSGGNSWDILRDPEVEIILASNIFDRSLEFIEDTKDTYKNNELFRQLYPEYAKDEHQHPHWNKGEMVTPAKKRRRSKPNIRAVSMGGSIQGVHGDIFKVDDPVGEHQLNSGQIGGAEFLKATNWCKAATSNVPKLSKTARVFLLGTRYGPNDPFGWVWDDMKQLVGCRTEEPFVEKPDGQWVVYYRAAREEIPGRGYIISMPEKWTHEELDKIEREDPWTYFTQIQNRSHYSGLSEFSDYILHQCWLDWTNGKPYVRHYKPGSTDYVVKPVWEMCLVQALDPSGMARHETARTSRWALVVFARDSDNNRYILRVDADFGGPTKWIPLLWANYKKWRKFGMNGTLVEMIGPFSILQDWLREEAVRRKESIRLRPVRAQKGDKDARIRMALQPILDTGRLYATEQALTIVGDEIMGFPSAMKKDVLDAIATAEIGSYRPKAVDEEEEEIERSLVTAGNVDRVTGY